MRALRSAAGNRYLRFLLATAAVSLALAALGWLVSREAGPGVVAAMLAGIGVAAAASALGALPLLGAGPDHPPERRVSMALVAIGLRLFLALVLGGLAWVSGRFAPRPLLVWLAVSYLALLAVDTYFALAVLKDGRATEK